MGSRVYYGTKTGVYSFKAEGTYTDKGTSVIYTPLKLKGHLWSIAKHIQTTAFLLNYTSGIIHHVMFFSQVLRSFITAINIVQTELGIVFCFIVQTEIGIVFELLPLLRVDSISIWVLSELNWRLLLNRSPSNFQAPNTCMNWRLYMRRPIFICSKQRARIFVTPGPDTYLARIAHVVADMGLTFNSSTTFNHLVF